MVEVFPALRRYRSGLLESEWVLRSRTPTRRRLVSLMKNIRQGQDHTVLFAEEHSAREQPGEEQGPKSNQKLYGKSSSCSLANSTV